MVNLAMDEEGATARSRSQAVQVSRSWFQTDSSCQIKVSTADRKVQVDLREQVLRSSLDTHAMVTSLEVVEDDASGESKSYRSPLGKNDITNIFDEALLESRKQLKGLSPNPRILESAFRMEILGEGASKHAGSSVQQRLEGKLEERIKLEHIQKELANIKMANQRLEATQLAVDDQAAQLEGRATALTSQQAHLNK